MTEHADDPQMVPRSLSPGQRSEVWIAGVGGPAELVYFADVVLLEAPNWSPDGRGLLLHGDGLLWRLGLRSERIRPVLTDISPNIVYCGGVGNGHAAKLVQNAVAACNRAITLECVAAACKSGLTLDKMPEVVNRSAGWNGGAERIIPALRTSSPTTDFQMGLMVKDLRLAMDLGNQVRAPMMIANAVRGLFQICANEKGPAQNLDEIARLIEQQGGLTFADYAS